MALKTEPFFIEEILILLSYTYIYNNNYSIIAK